MTVIAFFNFMVAAKVLPMSPLIRREDTRAATQWASGIERRNHRPTDKIGPVVDPFHRFFKRFVNLEAQYFGFSVFQRHIILLQIELIAEVIQRITRLSSSRFVINGPHDIIAKYTAIE
ncbi:MAG TPA: hypothetical protein PLF13_07425 [candidate division Zixibacteria bacterium]|nr:hypothetical protein [candidate division Zixibacteria bacterium]